MPCYRSNGCLAWEGSCQKYPRSIGEAGGCQRAWQLGMFPPSFNIFSWFNRFWRFVCQTTGLIHYYQKNRKEWLHESRHSAFLRLVSRYNKKERGTYYHDEWGDSRFFVFTKIVLDINSEMTMYYCRILITRPQACCWELIRLRGHTRLLIYMISTRLKPEGCSSLSNHRDITGAPSRRIYLNYSCVLPGTQIAYIGKSWEIGSRQYIHQIATE